MRAASRSVASRHGASTWDVPLVRLSRSLGGLGFSDGWARALLWIEDPICDQLHAVAHVPCLASRAGHVRQLMADRRLAARAYTREHGDDAPEIREWTWTF